jgi:phospholipid transport system transporter-binding protein
MKLDAARISNDNAAALLQRGLDAIGGGDLAFDLAAVSECNSAAVAMVLAWQRAAQEAGVELKLTGVPENLASLALLYGVDGLIAAR